MGGLLLIGIALMKLGILSGERNPAYYRKMMLTGYGLGLPIVIFSAFNLYAHDFNSLYMFRVGMIPNYIGSVLVSFGHIGVIGLQLVISPAWLERYRFGPVEWLWRSPNYWRRQPMRRSD